MRERADEESAGSVRTGPPAPPTPPTDGPEVLRVTGAIGGEAPRGESSRGDGPAERDGATGAVLVLASSRGTTFHLPVDGALRAALRQATTAPSAPDTAEPPLRPKEIQTRIRAGESATELAESSGAPLEQIERYAGPVLAERAHVATVARGTVVRTSRSRPTLEDLVRHRLASRGVALGTVSWDAWRHGEHGWALQVSFRAGTRDRLAQWSYDPVGESVEPLDDEARWLSASHEAESPGAGRRLSAVRVFDVESDGGVREVPGVPAPPLPVDTGPATGPMAGLIPGTGAGPGLDTGLGSALGAGPAHQPTGSSPAVRGDGAAEVDGADPAGTGAASVPWTGPDHDEVAARTMDLLDALSDRRGRRQPMPDLGPGGGWDDEDEEDDDLVDALLDDLPAGTHPRPGDDGPGALPPFGTPPPPPVVEPWLRSVPPPVVHSRGGTGHDDTGHDDTGYDTGHDDSGYDDSTGDLPAVEPVRWAPGAGAGGGWAPDGRGAGAPDEHDDTVGGAPGDDGGWEPPPAGRSPLLGLVPPLPEPGPSEPWTSEPPVSHRDLLSVREGRIGRADLFADTGDLGLADTGEMTAEQVRELHAAGLAPRHLPAVDEHPGAHDDRTRDDRARDDRAGDGRGRERADDGRVQVGRGGDGRTRSGRDGQAPAEHGPDHPARPDQHAETDHEHGPDGGPGRGASTRQRGSRRPSVPSWDEIVFGSPRTDSD